MEKLVKLYTDKLLCKPFHLQCIRRLQNTTGTEADQEIDIDYLRKEFLDPKIIDYIYHHKPELSAEEIFSKAIGYRSIKL